MNRLTGRQRILYYEFLYPGEYIDSTYRIDFDKLYKEGYRGIIFDIDNTFGLMVRLLMSGRLLCLSTLRSLVFVPCALKQQGAAWKSFAKQVGIKYIYKAGKPKPSGYRTAMERLGTDTKNTLLWEIRYLQISSELILRASGQYFVAPIDPHEEIQIVL